MMWITLLKMWITPAKNLLKALDGNFCLHCGSWELYSSHFCLFCNKFLSQQNFVRTPIPGLSVQSPWVWSSSNNHWMWPLVKQFKATSQHQALDPAFEDFVPLLPQNTHIIWLPIPSRSNPTLPYRMSQSLQQKWGGEIQILFAMPETAPAQKNKNRQERWHRTIQLISADFKIQDHHTYILVDDIVTTGATALKCLSLLGLEQGQILCFAQRKGPAEG